MPPTKQVAPGTPVRAGAPAFLSSRTQSTCSRRETEALGNTSSSAARPSLLRNVRRVSRERSVREDRLPSAIVVMEITRSQRGSLSSCLAARLSAFHPVSVCAMESVRQLDNDAQRINYAAPIHLFQVCSAWTDSADSGSQSPWGTLVSSRVACQASISSGAPPEIGPAGDGRQSHFPIFSI
jgi:hypothetical protein